MSSKGYPLRYDFAILNMFGEVTRLIEFDGTQHNEPTEYFGGEKAYYKLREHDWLKNRYAKGHHIPLVRIPYSERSTKRNRRRNTVLSISVHGIRRY